MPRQENEIKNFAIKIIRKDRVNVIPIQLVERVLVNVFKVSILEP